MGGDCTRDLTTTLLGEIAAEGVREGAADGSQGGAIDAVDSDGLATSRFVAGYSASSVAAVSGQGMAGSLASATWTCPEG